MKESLPEKTGYAYSWGAGNPFIHCAQIRSRLRH